MRYWQAVPSTALVPGLPYSGAERVLWYWWYPPFGMMPYPFGHGTHAEYVAAPARVFAPKPASVDHVQTAALPLASLTAWQALVENAQLQAGQRVLIHAAAGGVGHIAVQIAKARGTYVIGTASAEKHDFLRELGVDEAIDSRSEDFAERATDIDVVLDTIGGDVSTRSLRTLRPGGMVVSLLPIGSPDFLREADELGVRAARMLVDSSRSNLVSIAEFVDGEKLGPRSQAPSRSSRPRRRTESAS